MLTAVAYYRFIVARLGSRGCDVLYCVTAGDLFSDRGLVPRSLSVIPSSTGCDGRFYYRLALGPFTGQQ